MVQTAHDATRPLDRPTTEYSTCVTIPNPLHQVFYSCHDPRRCTPCRTCHLHTTRQANVILQMKQRQKKKNKTISDSNSNLTKSMTHHNQTKELTTWFLNLPLDESIDNKSTKFKVQIQDPMKHSLKTQKAKKSSRRSSKKRKIAKASERHKKRQSQAKWQERAKKSSKLAQKLKISSPPEINPPNTLNASSPL
jgi:hypothetical protein